MNKSNNKMSCGLYLGALVIIVAVILFIVGLIWVFQYYNTKSSNADNLGTFLSAALLIFVSLGLFSVGAVLVGYSQFMSKGSVMGMRSLARSPLARNM